jgi:spore coat protein U-like protein
MRRQPLISLALAGLLGIAPIFSARADWCDVTGGGVAFGAYDPRPSASLDTTGSLDIQCSNNFHATVSVSLGNGAGASYSGGRRMTRAGGGTLAYNLYANSARTQVLGDGTGASVTLPVSGNKHYTQAIWARILKNQPNAKSGSYTDTVVVTISY